MQESDDFYFPPAVGTYLRLARMAVFVLALILTPTWYLLISYGDSLPQWLQFIRVSEHADIPVLLRGDVIRCEDFVSAFDSGAQAVVSREITPENITMIKRELYKNGVNVRYDEI